MKRNFVKVLLTALVIALIVGIISFYVYDVVVLKEDVTKNLFRTIMIVAMLIITLMRLFFGNNRKSLDIYEKAYEKELGKAFINKPLLRKKLLCACRLYDESNYRKALKYLNQLWNETESVQDGVPVLLFIALCYTDAGVAEEAIKVYNRILDYTPDNPQVHSNLGILYMNVGRFDMALKHYNESIECDPDNYYTFVNRANYYFRIASLDEAISDAQKALTIKNNGHEAASLLTIIFALKQDRINKEKYYHIAITSGKNPDDLNNAIEYYLKQPPKNDEEYDV